MLTLNVFHTFSRCFYLIIFSLDLDPPILSTFNQYRIIENDDVILKCLHHATLPIKFSWFKDGVLLPGETKEKVLLSKINRRQKGEYKCVAINSVGSKESNLLVIDVKCKLYICSETAVQICFENHMYRSSRSQMFFKIGVLKNFAVIRRKTPVFESLFNKIAGLKSCNFIKKRLQHRCFPFFIEHLWLLPYVEKNKILVDPLLVSLEVYS